MDIISALMERNSLDQIALAIFLLLDEKSLQACSNTCIKWRCFILDHGKRLDFSNKYAKVVLEDMFEKGIALPNPVWLNKLFVEHEHFCQIGDKQTVHVSKVAPELSSRIVLFNDSHICMQLPTTGFLERFKWSDLFRLTTPVLSNTPPRKGDLVQLPTDSSDLALCFRDLLVWRSSATNNHAMLNVSKLNEAATKLEPIVSLDLRKVAPQTLILDISGWKQSLKLCQHGKKLLLVFTPDNIHVASWLFQVPWVYLFMIDLGSSRQLWRHHCPKRFENDTVMMGSYNIQPFMGKEFCGILLNKENISNIVMFLSNQSGNVVWESDKLITPGKYYVATSKSSVVVVPILEEMDDPQGKMYFFQLSTPDKVETTELVMKKGIELQGTGFWSTPPEGVLYADRYLGYCHSNQFYLHDLLSCHSGKAPQMRQFDLPGKSLGPSYPNLTGNVWLCYLEREDIPRGSMPCQACLLRLPTLIDADLRLDDGL